MQIIYWALPDSGYPQVPIRLNMGTHDQQALIDKPSLFFSRFCLSKRSFSAIRYVQYNNNSIILHTIIRYGIILSLKTYYYTILIWSSRLQHTVVVIILH